MAIKSALHFVEKSKTFINSEATKIKYRISETDFTRNRKLSFEGLSFCLIKLLRQNIQLELNNYFSRCNDIIGTQYYHMTSSAFIQSRKKLKPDMFYDLSKLMAEEFYQDNDESILLYKGHRLLAIDGSTLTLPVNRSTKEIYGIAKNQQKMDDIVMGRVSILYDLLNEMVIDGKLGPYSIGEVTMSRYHHNCLKKNDIVIMDRAYSNFQSIHYLQTQSIHFIYRCKVSFSNEVSSFYESKKKEAVVEIKPAQHHSFKNLPYTKETSIIVRMIRVELPSGEAEILMTSLLDKKKHPKSSFKKLYFKRWGVETFYNRFKNIISVEHFSGTSDQFIQQEFNCALYMSNLQSIFTKEAQLEANLKYQGRMYEYKVNSSLSLGFIRKKITDLFLSKKGNDEILIELKTLFIMNVVPIRPKRSFYRDSTKYLKRRKPKQSHNRRTVL